MRDTFYNLWNSFSHGNKISVVLSEFQWFLGLALGDFGYLGSLVLIGPRRGVLLASMAPVFSTISAYFILDETLEFQTLIGIFITLLGIIIVVIEREKIQ